MAAAHRHLPPGREPGKQSRRVVTRTSFGFALTVFFALAAWVAAILIATTVDGRGRIPGTISFGVAGLIFAGLGELVRRYNRGPRPIPGVKLTVDRTELRRGETVVATVAFDAPRAGAVVDVALTCTERWDQEQSITDARGNTTKTRQTQLHDTLVAERPQLAIDGASHTIELAIPPDAPPSYEGDCVSWAWAVNVGEDRQHRSDRDVVIALWVTP